MVPSGIRNMSVGWGVSRIGICILMEGMVVEGVEKLDAWGEEMEVVTYVMSSWEEVMGMEEL